MALLNETQPKRQNTARRPVRHTKTFSGCWTCRERHVKCDEERPQCRRCRKGGYECQGYGVKLVWPGTQEREQNIRRVIGSTSFEPDPALTQVDVQLALDSLENVACDSQDLSFGPFSVFAVQPNCEIHSARDNHPAGDQPVSGDEINSPQSPKTADDDDGDCYPCLSSSSSTGTDSPMIMVLAQRRFSPVPRHIDLLPRPAEQRDLIHHWTDFICWHIVPVDAPDNLFRSVFTPLAMAGLLTPSYQSSGQIALFHSLCATAAFSRSHLLRGDVKSCVLGLKHYQLAIMHLRYTLMNQADRERGAILATITMFSAMDSITGRSSEWRTHLQGGASWLATIEGSIWDRDKSSSMVYQGYLAMAALCNITLPSTIDVESENWLDSRFYALDRFFGLTRPMLKHIVMMNALVRQIRTADPLTLDRLEAQLYMQAPDNLALDGFDARSQALTRHHAYVFYYASLIYFQRTVRRRPPDSLQDMVHLAVGHLEEIEELGGNMIGCTLVWPPFVVACECLSPDLQNRILAWYKLKQRHGFMNLELSKDIARELWRRRVAAPAEADIQWQDVLQDLKMDIVLA